MICFIPWNYPLASSKLNPRQITFIDNYILTLNATDAAIKAGYSKKTATVIGHENLSKPYIAKEISRRLGKIQDDKASWKEDLLQMLHSVAMTKLSDFGRIGPSGMEMLEQEQIDEKKLIALQEFSVHESNSGVNVRIKLSDRLKAAELLMKHMGMFVDKVEVSVTPPPTVIELIDGRRIEVGIIEGEIVK